MQSGWIINQGTFHLSRIFTLSDISDSTSRGRVSFCFAVPCAAGGDNYGEMDEKSSVMNLRTEIVCITQMFVT